MRTTAKTQKDLGIATMLEMSRHPCRDWRDWFPPPPQSSVDAADLAAFVEARSIGDLWVMSSAVSRARGCIEFTTY